MKFRIILLSLLILAAIVRLFSLQFNPVSLFSDEADAGYQAMYLNKCNSDYFGNKFPFHLHSFSDFRTPFYIYSVSLSQKIINNKEISVRLPAAIFGILTCFAIYLLSKKLTNSQPTALIATFITCISPWLIHYSRSGFEVTGMLFFLIMGLYFLLEDKYLQSLLFLIFSAYFYSTAKLFIILAVLTAIFFYYKKYLKINIKRILIIFLFTLLISLPYLKDTIQGKSGFRFSYINIFSDPTTSTQIDFKRFEDATSAKPDQIGLKTSFTSKIFHNKAQEVANKFVDNYLSSFGTNFLFLKGDNNLRHTPGTGYLFPFEFLLIIVGVIYFRKNKYFPFIITLFLLSPVSYALTRDSTGPHGTRLILMLPFLIIFTAIAINKLNKYLKILIFILYIYYTANFLHQYFVHYPQNSARVWHYGIKEVLNLSLSEEKNYSKISYSNKYEPFLPFFLYYRNYITPDCNTAKHIQNSLLDNKYYFGPIDFNNPSGLLVMPLSEFKENQLKLNNYTIYSTTNKKYTEAEQFVILKPNENK
jgi:4-amino-4-deoxy-L-arabinose transferase-like glycosyltransferase